MIIIISFVETMTDLSMQILCAGRSIHFRQRAVSTNRNINVMSQCYKYIEDHWTYRAAGRQLATPVKVTGLSFLRPWPLPELLPLTPKTQMNKFTKARNILGMSLFVLYRYEGHALLCHG